MHGSWELQELRFVQALRRGQGAWCLEKVQGGGLGLGFMGRTVKRNLLNLKLKTLNRKRMND